MKLSAKFPGQAYGPGRWLAMAALLTGLAGLPAAASPPDAPEVPARTDAGSYQGTWMSRDRAAQLAFWFDESVKPMQMRYRYEVRNSGYGDSGESGTGSSTSAAGAGVFKLTSRLDPDGVIRGTMERHWSSAGVEVIETNSFEAWRIEKGDRLYCTFSNRLSRMTRDGETTTTPLPDYSFTFAHLTDELVHWEELTP